MGKLRHRNRERNLKRYPNGLDDLPFDEWYCKKCKVLKSKYEFRFNPSNTYGILNLCKVCNRKPEVKVNPNEKECSKCKKVKSSVDFYKDRFNRSGLKSSCKSCEHEYQKHRSKKLNFKRVSDDILVKCSRCGETKKAIYFYSRRTSLNGLRSYCKECDDTETQIQREKIKQRKINEKAKKTN